jgi:AbrB family looped-hinge helix DNA binding protein
MKATITSKGQITIPAKVRRKLNLKTGQVLEFDEQAPYLKATRVFDPAEMYATIGCLKKRRARSIGRGLVEPNARHGKAAPGGGRNAHGD